MATDLERLVVSLDANVTSLTKKLAKATGDVDAFGKSADRATKRAAKQVNDNLQGAFRPDQWRNLSFQLNDVVTGLASGQRPMQVLAQQGGQVYQVMQQAQGGVGGAAKAILGLVTPSRLMGAAAAGSATLAIAAFAKWEAQTESLSNSLNGLGRKTGLGPQGLLAAARSGVAGANTAFGPITQGQGAQLAGTFARAGVSGANIPGAISVSGVLAGVLGKSLSEAGDALASALRDPAKAGVELLSSIGGLNAATLTSIQRAAANGDAQGAQRAVVEALSKSLADATQDINSVASATRNLKTGLSNWFSWLGEGLAKAFTPTDQQRVEQLNYSLDGPKAFLLGEQDRREKEAERAALLKKRAADDASAAKKEADQKANSASLQVKALAEFNQAQADGLKVLLARTPAERAAAEGAAAYNAAIRENQSDDQTAAARLAAFNRVIAETGKAAQDAVRDATNAASLAGLRPEQRAERQIEIDYRRRLEQFGTQPVPPIGAPAGGAGVSVKPYGGGASLPAAPGRNPDLAHVDQRLVAILAAAARSLPAGYRAAATEGYNAHGHAPGSQHHVAGSGAIDMQIFGPNGAIPNKGADTTGLYTQLAKAAKAAQLAQFPELNGKLAWGGAFGTVPGGGVADLMHFDLGGERGRITSNLLSRLVPSGAAPSSLFAASGANAADQAKAQDLLGLQARRGLDLANQRLDVSQYIASEAQKAAALRQTAGAAAEAAKYLELMQNAERQGLTVTPQLAATYHQIAQATGAQAQETADLAKQQEASNYVADSFADGLAAIATRSASAKDALRGLLQQMASTAIKGLLTGGGPLGVLGGASTGGGLGGIFGGLLGGFHFADGGQVPGVGGPRSDSVLARLSPGEYVVNAAATARHGALLQAINTGRLPRFADGGPVGGAISVPNAVRPASASAATFTVHQTNHITPADGVTPAQLAAVIEAQNRQLDRTIGHRMNAWQARYA
ncbi:phage tail length tape measure family protein [Methylocella sp.]|uniref:phage tail length tape measure family protein n=1 Tax=Methylocella sp. TaxID=1978226 RepID=UPI003783A5BA